MTARRTSGAMKVRLTLRDDDSYRCTVRDGDGRTVRVTVGVPKHTTIAIDCPQAFDEAARAALVFALGELDAHGIAILSDGCDLDTSGAVIVARAS